MQNGSSDGIRTRCTHIFARLAPIHVVSRCFLTKFLRRSSVGSSLRVRCWLGSCCCTVRGIGWYVTNLTKLEVNFNRPLRTASPPSIDHHDEEKSGTANANKCDGKKIFKKKMRIKSSCLLRIGGGPMRKTSPGDAIRKKFYCLLLPLAIFFPPFPFEFKQEEREKV